MCLYSEQKHDHQKRLSILLPRVRVAQMLQGKEKAPAKDGGDAPAKKISRNF